MNHASNQTDSLPWNCCLLSHLGRWLPNIPFPCTNPLTVQDASLASTSEWGLGRIRGFSRLCHALKSLAKFRCCSSMRHMECSRIPSALFNWVRTVARDIFARLCFIPALGSNIFWQGIYILVLFFFIPRFNLFQNNIWCKMTFILAARRLSFKVVFETLLLSGQNSASPAEYCYEATWPSG